MRPTKDQLADYNWWQDNVPDYFDFLYECESTGEIAFANRDGRDNDGLRLRLELDIWKLLAKRPEPEQWKPEVGVECLWFSPNANCWTHTKVIAYNDSMTSAWLEGEGVVAVNSSYSQFRPKKTQREEFVEEAKSRIKNMDADDIIFAGKLYDAGCRFDLTEKEGE
jgi:hypothetical protein